MKKNTLSRIFIAFGLTGFIALALFGNLLYMNLRPADALIEGWEDYTPARFEALAKTDTPVLVEIYASWCPTCLLQHKAFLTLEGEGKAPKIPAIRVDFDKDKAFIRAHNLTATGMLIVFEGGQEVKRGAGLVTPEKIAGFLDSYRK